MNERHEVFELQKIKREILTHGRIYTFERKELNKYGEETGKAESVATVRGIYHTSSGYERKTKSDATLTHSKEQPKILCLYDESENVMFSDFVIINDKKYIVTAIDNIAELGIVNDISLEVQIERR